MKYLNFTVNTTKVSHIQNPSGFFIMAIRNRYVVNIPLESVPSVPDEVIKQTERDIIDSINRELAESPPVSPSSPLYKYCRQHALEDSSTTT